MLWYNGVETLLTVDFNCLWVWSINIKCECASIQAQRTILTSIVYPCTSVCIYAMLFEGRQAKVESCSCWKEGCTNFRLLLLQEVSWRSRTVSGFYVSMTYVPMKTIQPLIVLQRWDLRAKWRHTLQSWLRRVNACLALFLHIFSEADI